MKNKISLSIIISIFLTFYTISVAFSQEIKEQYQVVTEKDKIDSLHVSPAKGKKKDSYFNRLLYGHIDHTHDRAIDLSYIAAPSYTREASFGIGGMATGLYRLDRKDSIMPPSNITLTGNASLLGFYALSIVGNNYFKDKKSILSYEVSFMTKNLDFWGIDYDACATNEVINYKRRQAKIIADYLYNLKKNIYIGATLNFTDSRISKIDDVSYLDGQKMAYTFTGLGLSAQYDSRDFIPNPSKGIYLMFRETIFPEVISSYNKTLFRSTIIADYYQKVWKGGIIATDLYGEFNSNDSPWPLKEEFGGGSRMRGYYSGRYIDNNIISLQVEMRQHIAKRFGCTAWIGTGTVFPSFDKFDISHLLPNYGIGLRYEFKHNVNIRIDYGFGKETGGFVFNIGEAF